MQTKEINSIKLTQLNLNRKTENFGSNPGGFFQDEAENEYYVKYVEKTANSTDSVINEILACKLYELFGIDVPNPEQIEFTHEKNEFIGVITKKIDNLTPVNEVIRWKDGDNKVKFISNVQKGFLIDALLANWDIIGHGPSYNLQSTSDFLSLRLDTGGCLLYRAQGEVKGVAFNEKVDEFSDIVNRPSHIKKAIFGEVYKSNSLLISLNKLLSVNDRQINDCIQSHGFCDVTKNKQLFDLLIKRKQTLIAKAEQKIFDNLIINPYLHTKPSAEDTSYQQFRENNTQKPIYRLKHGGMHASRTALHTEQFIDLLCQFNFLPAISLTDKDRFLIKTAAMFHDTGRKFDAENDNQDWENDSAIHCTNFLKNGDFGNEEIEQVSQAIKFKNQIETQANNIYALILAAADSLDQVRNHSSEFNIKKLPKIIQKKIPEKILLQLAKNAKQVACQQGDSPLDQLDSRGNFSIKIKSVYEFSPDGCYAATKEIYSSILAPSKNPNYEHSIQQTNSKNHNVQEKISLELNSSQITALNIPENLTLSISTDLKFKLQKFRNLLDQLNVTEKKAIATATKTLIDETLGQFVEGRSFDNNKFEAAVKTFQETVTNLSLQQKLFIAAMTFLGGLVGFIIGAAVGAAISGLNPIAAVAAGSTGAVIGASVGTAAISGISIGLAQFGVFKCDPVKNEATELLDLLYKSRHTPVINLI